MNSKGWLEYIGDRKVYSESDAIRYIKNRIAPQFERLGFGNYTIIRKADNVKIGTCGLYDREGIDGIDIGYALLPQFFGKGYAFEAVNELKNITFLRPVDVLSGRGGGTNRHPGTFRTFEHMAVPSLKLMT